MSSKVYNVVRFFIISILGVLLHFTYEWSGDNPAVGIFSAVNESTWEHLKLLFFPMLALTIWEVLRAAGRIDGFIQARATGIISGMLFIVVTFYTINGVFGKPAEFINILIYFLSVIFALWIENKMSKRTARLNQYTAIAILIFLAAAFAVFTFKAPDIGIFRIP